MFQVPLGLRRGANGQQKTTSHGVRFSHLWVSDKFRGGTLPVVKLDRISRNGGFDRFRVPRVLSEARIALSPKRRSFTISSWGQVYAPWSNGSHDGQIPCLANADCLREHQVLSGSHRVRFSALGRRRVCAVYHPSVHSRPTAGDLAPSSVPYWLRHETCSGRWGNRA